MFGRRSLCLLAACGLALLFSPCVPQAGVLRLQAAAEEGGLHIQSAMPRRNALIRMTTAGAATPGDAPAETGDFTVSGGKAGVDYSFKDHILKILSNVPITISGKTVQDRIYVESGVNATITLSGVSIQLPETQQVPAFQIADGSKGNVTVILADQSTNVLQGGKWSAGLQKDGSGAVGTLTIRCARGGDPDHVCTGRCGSLKAVGNQGAGIGSGASQAGAAHSTKNITVVGGNVHASSAANGAGIGAGSGGSAENLAIRGGIVEAVGGGCGVGDAAGSHKVTVSGGRLTARGGRQGTDAGIGGSLVTADASGRPGNACIITDSLADSAGRSAWSGLIVVGNQGEVCGKAVVLQYSAEIPAGVTLTVPAESSLTFADGVTLSVKGKMRVDGKVEGRGTVTGEDIGYRLTVKKAGVSGEIADDGYVKKDAQITLTPERPEDEEMVFQGWNCVPSDLKITDNRFRMPGTAVSVEARYGRREYTVAFDLNGGTADKKLEERKVPSGGKASEPDCALTPPSGQCVFDGWYTQDGKKWNFSSAVRSAMTLTAHWKQHTPAKEWTYENGGHYHKCENGCGTRLDAAECLGGKATCQGAAVCSVCGGTYKPVDPQTHAGAAEWIKDANGHQERYTCCGAVKAEKATHTWNASGSCSVCGYSCAHEKIEKKGVKSPTCTSDGYSGDSVCTVCGAVVKSGTRISRLGHSGGIWDYDSTGHWRRCVDCGRRFGTEQHIFTWWTSSDGWRHERCTECGYEVILSSSPGASVSNGNGGSPAPGQTWWTQPGGSVVVPPLIPQPAETKAEEGKAPIETKAEGGELQTETEAAAGKSPMPSAQTSEKRPGESSAQAAESAVGTGRQEQESLSGSGNGFWGPPASVTLMPEETSSAEQETEKTLKAEDSGGSIGTQEEDSALSAAGQALGGLMPWWLWGLLLTGVAVLSVAIVYSSVRMSRMEE